jgi:hypothetical protein
MAKLDGFQLVAGKNYAVGIGTKKKPIKTFYDVDMDQWYIRFGDAPWNHLGEYITANPGVEIDEIDSEGRQVASSTAEPGVAVTEVDVMPAVQSASALHAEPVAAVSGTESPNWME